MLFSSWLRKKTGPHANCPISGRRPARFRPGLETLEERSVPAILAVTTPLDVINPHDGQLSLREAVLAANADNGANTILLPSGTYTLALPGADEDAGHTGDLDLVGHVTIQGTGVTILDGAELDRVFHVHEGAKVTLSGLTIQRGAAGRFVEGGQVGYSDSGGGIANAGILTVRDCAITGNSADAGGGIMNGGTLTVRDSTISNNFSYFSYGGGIANSSIGNLTVSGSTFTGNFADYGGAISNFGSKGMRVTDSFFSDNSASDGGAIWFYGINPRATYTIRSSSFVGNHAGARGGAVYITGSTSVIFADCSCRGNSSEHWGGAISIEFGSLVVNNCTISDNRAVRGGGISTLLGEVSMHNSIVSGNTANEAGGGIYHDLGSLRLYNSSVIDNMAPLGSDLFLWGAAFVVHDSVVGDVYYA
jgi:hypothetical protein